MSTEPGHGAGSDGGGGQQIGAGEGSSADVRYPVVKRRFVRDGRHMMAQDMHAFLSTDIYLKACTGKDGDAPNDFMFFRGAESILLKRLEDSCLEKDVLGAVRPHEDGDETSGRALLISGRVRIVDKSPTSGGPADIVLVLPTEDLCAEWTERLRMRVMPWKLIRECVSAVYASRPLSQDPEALLESLRQSLSEDAKEVGGEDVGAAEQGAAPANGNGLAQRILNHLRRGEAVNANVNPVAQGTASLVRGGDLTDSVARALGGLSLVGPAISAARIVSELIETGAQSQEYRESLAVICARVPLMSRQMNYVVRALLSAHLPAGNVVNDLFKSLEMCWRLQDETERHLMEKRRDQFWMTAHAESIVEAMEALEDGLAVANVGAAMVEGDRLVEESFKSEVANLRDELRSLSQAEAKVLRVLTDKHEQFVYVGPGAPRLISYDAIPFYEDVVSATFSGGVVSISDAHRVQTACASSGKSIDHVARERRGESPAVFAVDGGGGVGKTTLLLLVAHDAHIRRKFDCMFFIVLGKDATEAKVVSDIADLVEASGGGALAAKIRAVTTGEEQVQKGVNLTRPWLSKTSVLLLDNIWSRKGSRSWAGELCPLVTNADSAVLLSTRDEAIAEHADPSKRFCLGLLKDDQSAQSVFELHAGLEPGACLPRGVLMSESNADDVRKYPDAIKFILRTCNGWPLPLAMRGKMSKETGFKWRLVDEKLRANVRAVEVSGGAIERAGLRAVLQTNLEMACRLTSTNPLLLATFGSKSASEDFLRQTDFADKYVRLSVLDASRSIPVYALGAVFDVKEAEAYVIAQIFAKVGLARLDSTCARCTGESGSGQDILVLHDLQHAFAESLSVKAGSSVSDQHTRLLRSIAKRFCGDGDALRPGFDWSALCEHRGCGKGKETLTTYMCDELVRHVLASCSDDLQDEFRISGNLGVLCSYRWILARGAAFDRPTVLWDFATAVAGLTNVGIVVEPGTARVESSNVTPFYGVVRALETIAEVVQRISPGHFIPDEPCAIHGERDTGLAAELYGRLAVLKFHRLDSEARRDAQNVVSTLLASIRETARPPWLLPRFECYGSVEGKDVRCIYESPAGDGAFRIVEYVRLGGMNVLLSGGWDTSLRLYDMGASGR
jgi:hypothetical protein